MADWSRHFDEPIVLPGGRQLLTLEDAGTKLPKAEHQANSRAPFAAAP